VRSQLGKGSQFRVMLRCSLDGDSTRAPSVAPSRRSRTGRILLVEDDPSVRQVTRMFLERDGHEVLVARDGVEAMSVIEREIATLDLVVLDAILPNASGPEVYRQFRKQSNNPVLFVTGHGFNTFDTLPEDSARAILDKPFTAVELSEAVQKLLAQWSVRLKTRAT
jgi:DNA-binding response OmpR family regulator